eukprot:Gb_13452 [translate_table: standard]
MQIRVRCEGRLYFLDSVSSIGSFCFGLCLDCKGQTEDEGEAFELWIAFNNQKFSVLFGLITGTMLLRASATTTAAVASLRQQDAFKNKVVENPRVFWIPNSTQRREGLCHVRAVTGETNSKPLTGVIFEPFTEVQSELVQVPKTSTQSFARQQFKDACEAALNEQIKYLAQLYVEYNVSYVYHALFAYFDRDNVVGHHVTILTALSNEHDNGLWKLMVQLQQPKHGNWKASCPLALFDHASLNNLAGKHIQLPIKAEATIFEPAESVFDRLKSKLSLICNILHIDLNFVVHQTNSKLSEQWTAEAIPPPWHFPSSPHWYFKEASDEERSHAEKLMKYQNMRGGRVKLQSILMPVMEFDHPEKGDALYAMELTLSLEKLTNEKLLSLHSVRGTSDKLIWVAQQCNDAQMTDFIEGNFLAEQVEAIKKVSEYVAQLRRIGKGHGVWQFDQMLLKGEGAADGGVVAA